MESPRPNFRRTRQIRQMANWMSRTTILHTPVTVVKAYQPAQSLIPEIAGIRQLSSEKVSTGFRILWLIIIVGATNLCILQCADRIAYFLTDPSSADTHHIQNNTIKLPDVIMCPIPVYSDFVNIPTINIDLIRQIYGRATSIDNIFNWFEMGNVSLTEIWRLSKLDVERIFLLNYGVSGLKLPQHSPYVTEIKGKIQNLDDLETMQTLINVTEVYTPVGTCHLIKFNSQCIQLTSRPIFELQVKMDTIPSGVHQMVTFKMPEDSPIDVYFYHLNGIKVEFDESRNVFVQVTELVFRNTSKNPCGIKDDVSNCLLECFENIFIRSASRKHCRLPFMRHFNDTSTCSSKLELHAMMNATRLATTQFNPAECNCWRNCHQILYKVQYVGVKDDGLRKYKVIVVDGRITTTKEEEAYSIYDAVADVGGSLSLWLGVCFLHILEVITFCVSKVLFKAIPKKTKPKPSYVKGRRFQIIITRNTESRTTAFPTLNLPGFTNVAKSESSLGVRAAWLVITLIASLLCINQCVERIALYFSDTTEVNVYFTNDISVPSPSIMVCPNRTVGPIFTLSTELIREEFGKFLNYTTLLHLMSKGQLTFEDIWNMSGFSFKYMDNITASNEDWISSVVPTILGNCINFQSKLSIDFKRVPTAQVLYIYDDNETDYTEGDILVAIYPTDDLALAQYLLQVEFDGRNAAFLPAFKMDMFTAFQIKQVSYRNLQKTPCSDRDQVVRCLVKCFEKKVAVKISRGYCRLPFMNTPISTCNTAAAMEAVLNSTTNTITTFNSKDCGCYRACKEFLYTKEYFTTNVAEEGRSAVLIQFWNKELMVMEEIRAYNGFMLFSDLGCAVGLFSGICLMNMFEIFESLLYKMFILLWSQDSLKKTKKQIVPNVNHREIIIVEGHSDVKSDLHQYTDILSNSNQEEYKPRMWNQILWTLLSAGIFCPCTYLIIQSVQHYLSEPSTSATYYSNNITIIFPAMIICADVEDSIYGEQREVVNFLDYWNTSKFQPKRISVQINGKWLYWNLNENFTSDVINYSVILTAAGICFMISSKSPVAYIGYRTEIAVFLTFSTKKNSWAAFPTEKSPLLRYLHPRDVYSTNGARPTFTHVSLQITEYNHRETWKRPCADSREVATCLADCIERKIYEKHGRKCRLPFMQESKTYQLCETTTDYLKVKDATLNILENHTDTECNCPKERRVTMYSVDELETSTFEGDERLIFSLHFRDNVLQSIQEMATFSFGKLLLDFGGYLGLFFGFGLPQLLEILSASISQLRSVIYHMF